MFTSVHTSSRSVESRSLRFAAQTGRRLACIIGGLLLAISLAGCSATKLAYNQAPTLLGWWLDDWFDFDRKQQNATKASLVQLQTWHRRQVLPEWIKLMEQLASEMPAPTTPERVCYWGDQIQAQTDIIARQSAELAASIVPTFEARQFKQLAKRIQQRNDEWAQEWMPPTPREQLEHRYDKTLEQAEKWYGRLDSSQKQLIHTLLEQSAWSAAQQLAQVKSRQQDLQVTLRSLSNTSAAKAQTALLQLWERYQQPLDEADRAYTAQLRLEICDTFARVHNSTTSTQREHARQRLLDFQDDLQMLAAQ